MVTTTQMFDGFIPYNRSSTNSSYHKMTHIWLTQSSRTETTFQLEFECSLAKFCNLLLCSQWITVTTIPDRLMTWGTEMGCITRDLILDPDLGEFA